MCWKSSNATFRAFAPQRVLRISGGERQRVAIAKALINTLSIHMGDGPTGNFDRQNSEMLSAFLNG